MPRVGTAVVLGGALLVLVAAVIVLAGDERRLAFANGVPPAVAAVQLAPGQRACQPAVAVLEPFGGVELAADTGGRGGPALEVTVLDRRARRTLGSGRVPGGYAGRLTTGGAEAVARVGRVRAGREVEVCVVNAGSQPVGLGGTVGRDRRGARVQLADGRRLGANLHLTFLRQRPTSLLALMPTAFERAALFHPPVVGAWTFWLLAALLALGVPALLARALAAASQETAPAPAASPQPGEQPL